VDPPGSVIQYFHKYFLKTFLIRTNTSLVFIDIFIPQYEFD